MNTVRIKRSLLMGLGLLVGLGIAYGGLLAWYAYRTHRLTGDEVAALKAAMDGNPSVLFQYDPDVSYTLKPAFRGIWHGTRNEPHATNSRGLLGEEEVNLDPVVKRILFLGDSVTYGDGVPFEQIFTSRMQTQAGKEYQIMNAGTPGWSTRQECTHYFKTLADLPWDVVVLVFCLNDLLEYEWRCMAEGQTQMSAEVESLQSPLGFLLSLDGWQWKLRKRRFASDQRTAPLAELTAAAQYAWDDSRWQSFERFLQTTQARMSNGPPLLVVAMPTAFQLNALLRGAPVQTVMFPQLRLNQLCRKNNIAFIDAACAFENLVITSGQQLWASPLHLGRDGHALVARYLWPRIQDYCRRGPAPEAPRLP